MRPEEVRRVPDAGREPILLASASARVPRGLEALEARADDRPRLQRVSPASRVSQRSNSRSVGTRPAKGPPFTLATRASGSMGNVTTEISHRSTFSSRRMPVRASRFAFTARNPIDRPSSAPARISESTSRARATSGISRPTA